MNIYNTFRENVFFTFISKKMARIRMRWTSIFVPWMHWMLENERRNEKWSARNKINDVAIWWIHGLNIDWDLIWTEAYKKHFMLPRKHEDKGEEKLLVEKNKISFTPQYKPYRALVFRENWRKFHVSSHVEIIWRNWRNYLHFKLN